MKQTIKQLYNKIQLVRYRNGLRIRDKKQLKNYSLPELSSAELESMCSVWPVFDFKDVDLTWSKVYKKECGFSPYYVNDTQYKQILKAFNPYSQLVSFENKALVDRLFPDIPYPKVFLRKICGKFYDASMNFLSEVEACNLINHSNVNEFILKPSVDSQCGAGVMKITDKQVVNWGGVMDNFICQEVLRQNQAIAALNPSSVNCCRITTIFINGKVSSNGCLKIGKKGSHIDNWNSAYLVGVNDDGNLKSFGYDFGMNRVYESDSGIKFGGFSVPKYSDMKILCESLHKKYFPNCGIAGWDVMVDDRDNVRVIEVNLTNPGVLAEQLCSGVFFEPYHDEIVNRLNNLRRIGK